MIKNLLPVFVFKAGIIKNAGTAVAESVVNRDLSKGGESVDRRPIV